MAGFLVSDAVDVMHARAAARSEAERAANFPAPTCGQCEHGVEPPILTYSCREHASTKQESSRKSARSQLPPRERQREDCSCLLVPSVSSYQSVPHRPFPLTLVLVRRGRRRWSANLKKVSSTGMQLVAVLASAGVRASSCGVRLTNCARALSEVPTVARL